ncbi:low-affinity Na(+)/H(+) antiporter NhaS1-like [Hypanus sabinus]|uniref:low-affinity Na(+)/H(+) antiporter NhaS1-like n=1 Tax=Hypanus sabinus TaxID=79690 RepID=UPI0028C3A4F1|nr:low-affinity Na(+)/H(+) antiporter NhaS1-like [Hypanus sabinus]
MQWSGVEQLNMYNLCDIELDIEVTSVIRTLLKGVKIPYTVIVCIIGIGFGTLSTKYTLVQMYSETIAKIDPLLLIHTFMPVLIFSSAFEIESHVFLKSLSQVVLLAGPGLVLSAAMIAVLAVKVYSFNWDWYVGVMFGSILACTDPITTVALLRNLGASKALTLLIEGESLLNDGTAIVMFEVFRELALKPHDVEVVELAVRLMLKVFVSPVFGYIMAKITMFCLTYVFNDGVTEITISLANTYIAFYVGEWVGISGVISVTFMGLFMDTVSFSPEIEVFLLRFWEMLTYLGNSLIFMIVGVVISQKALKHMSITDGFFVIVLYFGINTVRLMIIMGLAPLLKRLGYGFNWRWGAVCIWSGTKGAFTLSLALTAYHLEGLDEVNVRNKILLHVTGTVLLTLLINGTTMEWIIDTLAGYLGKIEFVCTMDNWLMYTELLEKYFDANELANENCTAADKKALQRVVSSAQKIIRTQLPALENTYSSRCLRKATSVCLRDIPAPKRMAMYGAIQRIRESQANTFSLLKMDRFLADANWVMAEKLVQIDDPYKSHNKNVHVDEILPSAKAFRCPDCEKNIPWEPSPREIDDMMEEARVRLLKAQKTSYWRQYSTGMLNRQAARTLISITENMIDSGRGRISKYCHRMVYNSAFECFIYLVILINIFPIILECIPIMNIQYDMELQIVNYVFFIIYVTEALMKILAVRKSYFLGHWNQFDLFIITLAAADIIVDQVFDRSEYKVRIVRIFRLIRLARILRLLKIMLPSFIHLLNKKIIKQLCFGYDIGKGYVVGEEDVSNLIDHISDQKVISQAFTGK